MHESANVSGFPHAASPDDNSSVGDFCTCSRYSFESLKALRAFVCVHACACQECLTNLVPIHADVMQNTDVRILRAAQTSCTYTESDLCSRRFSNEIEASTGAKDDL
eukprot:8022466-Karenia_brevis.AAC.1